LETLQPSSLPDAAELADLLTRYEFEGLLYAHDAIATQDIAIMAAGTPSCEDDSSEQFVGEENIKIIKIEKTNEPLVCDIDFHSLFQLCGFVTTYKEPQAQSLNSFSFLYFVTVLTIFIA
jgi:hypothetical protein